MTAKATVPEESQHPGQVAEPRPDDRDIGLQRMSVNDCRDGVGGVVEAVDEFEAQSDEQRKAQQQVGPDAGDGDRIEVPGHVKGNVAEAAGQGQQNSAMPARLGVLVILRSSRDVPEGIASTVVARSAIRFHQCGRRDSGHAWAS